MASPEEPPTLKRARSPFEPNLEFCPDYALTNDAYDYPGVIEDMLKELIIHPERLRSGCAFSCKQRHGPNWRHCMCDDGFVLMKIHGPQG